MEIPSKAGTDIDNVLHILHGKAGIHLSLHGRQRPLDSLRTDLQEPCFFLQFLLFPP